MKVAVIGISGRVGARVADELLRRNHQVVGIARKPADVAARPGLEVKAGDANDPAALAALIRGADAVISAGRFLSLGAEPVLAAVRQAGVPRLLVVGGAGSLEIAPGKRLIDLPEFPAEYKAEASAGADFLQALRAESQIDWTFLSPAALFEPGERTGTFRVGGDQLLADAQGNSNISMEDYAIALVDELEAPKHSRRRFSVAY
ncbi:NAD(P)-dependent oxidoreductase [Bordetella genomosp. 1]|uniref:3-beta hydroxysteroid dehydrogenase n=1 Tax=Bordetella genomosp. 1 TaxID=1395607 RepID=A0ABX4F3W7_9BORD|nr:NAD(P)-dependent oxidoreductase [Bordetella genomosp. 1]OZI68445.1 3-beta hydroxysteroid dehydrogenase [Bordetella genomosp. 1]